MANEKEYEKRLFSVQHDEDSTTLVKKLEPLLPNDQVNKDDALDFVVDLMNVFQSVFHLCWNHCNSVWAGRKLIKHENCNHTRLPDHVLGPRHTALEFQHRMHPLSPPCPLPSIW